MVAVAETLTRNASPCAAPAMVKSTSTRLFHGQRWRALTSVIDASANADVAITDVMQNAECRMHDE